MNNRKRLYAVIAGVCAVMLAALTFLLFYDNSSDEYKTYTSYMEEVGKPALNENAATEDAKVVCAHYEAGNDGKPWSYMDSEEVMALVRGYCPEYVDVASGAVPIID